MKVSFTVTFSHLTPQRELDESIDMLRTKNVELESVLEYLKAQPEKVDVDEAIMATHPLYNQ